MNETIALDPQYKQLIQQLKQTVRSARLRAMLAVNAEQIQLYWHIGHTILTRQQQTKWGSKLLDQVAADLQQSFPGIKGFSRRNLFLMQQFAAYYPNLIAAQSVPQLAQSEIVQQLVAQLPWGHIVLLIQKVKDETARDWYAEQSIIQGWSREVLSRSIKNNLYDRQGKTAHKLSNFSSRLPAPQSELAESFIQDPIDFGFLPIHADARERDIELGLVNHVRDLLLCLGKGFAFVGNQYAIAIDDEDFFIDLLLFNIELNCYVVVELKKGKFKPEYSGKLNFYLSVVDDLVKKPHHEPTLGLLLCESHHRVVAEYALSRIESPMGIAEYQLSKQIPEKLRHVLPSAELLEDQLSDRLKETTMTCD